MERGGKVVEWDVEAGWGWDSGTKEEALQKVGGGGVCDVG